MIKAKLNLLLILLTLTSIAKSQIPQKEFEALKALYKATDGDNWTSNSGWDTTALASDVTDSWYGVTVSDGHVTKLYLHDNKLMGDLPPQIGNLSNLIFLNLTWNSITSVPAEIGFLTQLVDLDLYHNNLTQLPKEIGNLKNLTRLNLPWNKLTSLPIEIGNLSNLEELDLNSNKLTSLTTEIWKLVNLKQLEIGDIGIESLPAEIGNLSNLEWLYVPYCKLTNLPKEVWHLTKLTNLYLMNNNLTSLPKELGNLNQLTNFRIDHNQLSELPDEFEKLSMLEYLEVHSNMLTTLPPSIGKLNELIYLNASYNNIKNLPSEIGDLQKLTDLYLSGNEIDSIPQEIGSLTKLNTLYLKDNQLSSLPSVDKSFKLKELDISENHLTYSSLEEWSSICVDMDYCGQKTTEKVIYVKANDTLIIDSKIGGEYTSCSWYRDRKLLSHKLGSIYRGYAFNPEQHTGVYKCSCRNSKLDDMGLSDCKIVAEITVLEATDSSAVIQTPQQNIASIVPLGNKRLQITMSHGQFHDGGTINIINTNGQVIQQTKLYGEVKQEINLQNCPTGIYFIQLSSSSGVQTIKIILE